jgi:hypothetical protein
MHVTCRAEDLNVKTIFPIPLDNIIASLYVFLSNWHSTESGFAWGWGLDASRPAGQPAIRSASGFVLGISCR